MYDEIYFGIFDSISIILFVENRNSQVRIYASKDLSRIIEYYSENKHLLT